MLGSCLALEGSDRYFTSLTPELSLLRPGELCWLCMWLGGKELVVLFIGAPFQRAKEQTGYLSTKAIISQESCCREQQEPTWLIERKYFPYIFSFFLKLPMCMSPLNFFFQPDLASGIGLPLLARLDSPLARNVNCVGLL